MYVAYYLSSGLFPLCILLILYINSLYHRGRTLCDRLLRSVMVTGILLDILDTLSWMLDGKDFRGSVVLQYVINGGGDILIALITYFWFLYVFEKLIGSIVYKKKKMLSVTLPVVLSSILIIITPFTHWIFYINENKEYVRGTFFNIMICVPVIFVVGASAMAIIRYRKEIYETRKRNCILLASFPIFPLIGTVFQALHYGLSIYIPCLTMSVLLIYLNEQNHNLTLDALTQLNNRGQLNRYLERRISGIIGNNKIFFLLMDVDDFKEINDTHGHTEGDEALIMVSDALKQTFKQRDAFIARYGGDEFAVIIENIEEKDLNMFRNSMNQILENMTKEEKKPYRLCISIGAVQCGMNDISTINDLICAADAEMFRIKNNRKARKRK